MQTATTVRQDDFVSSVADALQHISYYHPVDYITALGEAYRREASPAARDAIAQILTNSRMCAEGHRPVCQDTGIVVVFLKIGMQVRWDAELSVDEMVNEGVRRAYLDPDNVLQGVDRGRSCGRPEEHPRQHAGGDPHADRARPHGRGDAGGEGRRVGKPGAGSRC